jgi:hypothetical protein
VTSYPFWSSGWPATSCSRNGPADRADDTLRHTPLPSGGPRTSAARLI